MKLPSSSSLLLATLAISSSSSTLAAPAGECDTAMTTSSSNHDISAFLDSPGIRDIDSADIDIEQKASTTVVKSEVDPEARRMPTLLELIHTLPIIGHPFASLFEKSFLNSTDSVEGLPVISPDELNALQAAIAEVSRTLNQTVTGVPSAVQSAPTAMSDADGLNTNSSTSNNFSSTSTILADAFAATADGSTTIDGATSTQAPSESTSAPPPSSPTIPGNPPNTPVPPAAHRG